MALAVTHVPLLWNMCLAHCCFSNHSAVIFYFFLCSGRMDQFTFAVFLATCNIRLHFFRGHLIKDFHVRLTKTHFINYELMLAGRHLAFFDLHNKTYNSLKQMIH